MLTDADKKPAAERPWSLSSKNIEISGIVQGVGFRPFIYQLARRHGLNGRVINTSTGVSIRAEGSPDKIKDFLKAIETNAPPLARITGISSQTVPPADFTDFIISQSQAGAQRATLIAPDMSVCPDCLAELFDPADRRYGYPFINCTNCGPRYTIIDDVPYDRPNTSMKHFTMCPDCQAEYDDPDNRRFHAQPNACPVCGPRLRLFDNRRNEITEEDPIPATASLLKQGRIVAIKGLGGFHLAVDARNAEAVARLRRQKHRAEKPFALMSPDVETVRQYARVNEEEERLLTSLQRPIVLLEKSASPLPAEAVSPGNRYFGVMLPYAPPHYLLLSHGLKVLVMTSANLSEEPIAIDNQEAFTRLSEIADFFLTHDRDIYLRADDSITRHLAGADRFVRRSRGYVPAPLLLNQDLPPILACGAELKNTVCLTKNNLAFLSQHIGDLENPRAFDFFRQTITHLKRILDIEPEIIACDMHPGYLSTRYALEQTGARLTRVQHHHAHIAGCLAENGIDGPVIGLALDGTGYGTDGHIWGGEILVAEAAGFERPAHLAYVPMPGGEAAIREPWRMGISYLLDACGEEFDNLDLAFLKKIAAPKLLVIRTMISQGLNSPLTSSLGRLFDGVAAILGCGPRVSFEGQAA
ncbi:MAG: carbamoyltransferase HypF, partial [Desulfosudaceae bacterium]